MLVVKKVKNTVKVVGLCTSIALLSGCGIFSNVDSQQFAGVGNAPIANPSSIILATNIPKNCVYKDLGSVSVRDVNMLGFSRSSGDIQSDLQSEAATMGGNAVIGLRLNMEFYQGNVVLIKKPNECTLQKM